ncbi:MAG: asparaginase domain-containing protein [Psychromonas sp.]
MTSKDSKKIQLIITGGTIDSYYDIDKCTTMPHKTSVLPAFLDKYARVGSSKIETSEICMKDSRDITKEDIYAVYKAIIENGNSRHIVTHGTFTLFASARYLQTLLADNHGQVIIFTGSMIPLEGFSPNDAGFNLGSAIMAAQCLDAGVYIAFNGQIYTPEDMHSLH